VFAFLSYLGEVIYYKYQSSIVWVHDSPSALFSQLEGVPGDGDNGEDTMYAGALRAMSSLQTSVSNGHSNNEGSHQFPSNSGRGQNVATNEGFLPRVTSLGGSSEIENVAKIKRKIAVSKAALERQESLADSEDYDHFRDPLYEGECVPMASWQETIFPKCNMFHEIDYYGKALTGEFEHLTSGGYNDIFLVDDRDIVDDSPQVIKFLEYGTDVNDRNFDRVRRDGLILERSTKSPYVLDIYGHCGFAIITPYATGGTLSKKIRSWKKADKRLPQIEEQKLRIALEAAKGLAAVHDIDGEGLSSVSHGDLKANQYLFLDGKMKLADFNRGRFIRRNSTAPDTACTYTIGKNDAAFRSPEEYEYLPQTAAIDVWALGSIFFQILTGKEVWSDISTKAAQKKIRRGKLPKSSLYQSDDKVDKVLKEAIDMCYVFEPADRPKADEVVSFLQMKYSELFEKE